MEINYEMSTEEPDQIDMMSEEELRAELRKVLIEREQLNRRTDPVKAQLQKSLELAWYELSRIFDKHAEDWGTGDAEAAESVIENMDKTLKAAKEETERWGNS